MNDLNDGRIMRGGTPFLGEGINASPTPGADVMSRPPAVRAGLASFESPFLAEPPDFGFLVLRSEGLCVEKRLSKENDTTGETARRWDGE